METLAERASFLRESLQKSEASTGTMATILSSFDHRLSALEAAMRPIQVRTHAFRIANENLNKTLKSAEVILARFDLSWQSEAKILKGPHKDLESYLEAVDQLRSNIRFFSSNQSFKCSDGVVDHGNNLLKKAIVKLEEEFKQLLSSSSPCPSSVSLGHQGDTGKDPWATKDSEHQAKSLDTASICTPPTLIPSSILPLLHELAHQLVKAGLQQQCLKIYSETRASTLELSLQKLGVKKVSKDDVQKMQWEVLQAKINKWTTSIRVAVKMLFAGELEACDQVFQGIDFRKDQCFAKVIANSASVLLTFGEAVVKSKRSPEKLFVLLDMYETMCELQSEIETIFRGKACSEIRESALSLTRCLSETAQEIFDNFWEAVEKDSSKTDVFDGAVHPLTNYVINYVKYILAYRSTLKHIFQESESGDETNSQLAIATVKIMHSLQSNLEGKSKQYKDPALAYIFLMNNIHYMVRSVRRSEAKDLLGDDWVQRHRRIVQQNANHYRRVAWAKILHCLSVQGLSSSVGTGAVASDAGSGSGVSRATVKERFKSFNMQFEELHVRQSQWTVPDPDLRESLRLAVAELLLPAYRSSLKHFGALAENGTDPRKYIKYTLEDLEGMVGDFFSGKT